MVDANVVADLEQRERLGRVDRPEQFEAGADRVRDRDEMVVERARGNLIEQQSLGLEC
jgi:hypothetical protein